MEQVLQLINRNYISSPYEEIKKNNEILNAVLSSIINELKNTNELFKMMYSGLLFGGSYYDGLKVGEPNEYDIDILLKLPKSAKPEVTRSNIPGYAEIRLKDFEKFQKQPEAKQYKELETILDKKHYMLSDRFFSLFESFVTKALGKFPKVKGSASIEIGNSLILINIRKSGPAFTLELIIRDKNNTQIYVDLVPSFQFTKDEWLSGTIRKNPIPAKPNFFVVSKKPNNEIKDHRYWRLSFPEQERALLHGRQNLKPAIKIIKKLRDTENHTLIASYYIKTIFLWKNSEDKNFGKDSLDCCVMTMLKMYRDNLKDGKIWNFWDKEDNLLKNIKKETLTNMANRLSFIINDIEKNETDPFCLANYLVSDQEIAELKKELTNSSKVEIANKLQKKMN